MNYDFGMHFETIGNAYADEIEMKCMFKLQIA